MGSREQSGPTGSRAIPSACQQRLGLLEVGRVKALGEPAVDRGQERVGLRMFPLLLPQAAQTRGGAQLPGLRLLATGNAERLLETGCGRCRLRDGLAGGAARPGAGRPPRAHPPARWSHTPPGPRPAGAAPRPRPPLARWPRLAGRDRAAALRNSPWPPGWPAPGASAPGPPPAGPAWPVPSPCQNVPYPT